MIKNIIFDIGNVLVSFQPQIYFQSLLQEKCEEICHIVFYSKWWKQYDNGWISLKEVQQALLQEYPNYNKEILSVSDHWFTLMRPIDEMLQFLDECKQNGYHIYMISNLSEDSYDYLQEQYHLFDQADGMVLSFQEKFGKPDPRMYQFLCKRYALAPSTCLFLDDRKENIDAAAQCGIRSIEVKDIKTAIKEAKKQLC